MFPYVNFAQTVTEDHNLLQKEKRKLNRPVLSYLHVPCYRSLDFLLSLLHWFTSLHSAQYFQYII